MTASPAHSALKTIDHLVEAALVALRDAEALQAISTRYAVSLTPDMAALAAEHPEIARQFVPDPREAITRPDERDDPIGDYPHSPLKGLVHRYPDRVLIKLTHTCPVYCRFCFRREMVGPDGHGNLNDAELDAIFAYLAAHHDIFEVIFTGGDPLMLSARRIRALGERLASLAHISVVRWHSRVPVVSPERISDDVVRALHINGKAVFVSVHANHAAEFTPQAQVALARLADRGIALIGQSVLLKGVNAEVETLLALFRAMLKNRVRPVYLHHPDLAPGTGHFRLSFEEGMALHSALRGQLSGPAIPAYVVDIPGGYGKVPVTPDAILRTGSGLQVLDPKGVWRGYAATSDSR